MTPLILLSLLGLGVLLPAIGGDADEANDTDDLQDIEETSEEENDLILEPATATLDETTNVVTVTTDPNETGTLYTVANRVDVFDGGGNVNPVYETSVLLVPEGVDLLGSIFPNGDEEEFSNFYYDVLSRIGATEVAFWSFDPAAAPGEEDALPDYEYPADANTAFVQIYTENYGDGGQISEIIEVADQDALLNNIETNISYYLTKFLDDNGGVNILITSSLDAQFAAFETTMDSYFEGQLVRTEVFMEYSLVNAGTDFAASALTLAGQVSETPTPEGAAYEILDGSLTAEEFFRLAPETTPFNSSYRVSTTEFDTDGSVLSEEVFNGVGVSSNADIVRYTVRIEAEATRLESGGFVSNGIPDDAIVTAFANAEQIEAAQPPSV